jgi:DNA-binding PadR family transcriptional regulator
MSEKELMILRLLMEHPNGLFGSDFVDTSKGVLKRGSIYTTLDRMVAKGYVKEAQEPTGLPHLTPRTRHTISAAGRRAFNDFLSTHRLALARGSLVGSIA